MNRPMRLFALALGLALVAPSVAARQAGTATVAVTVTLPSGSPGADVEVLLQVSQRGTATVEKPGGSNVGPPSGGPKAAMFQQAKTVDKQKADKDGKVTFANVKPGQYRVAVVGTNEFKPRQIPVTAEAGKTHNVVMKLMAK